jgi:glycosyltransferase involved in cell wall biosynthesis
MSLRIQIYQQFHPGPHAPGTLQTRKLVRFLASRGHQVNVIAGSINASNEQTEPEESQKSENGGYIKVHRLPSPRGMRRNLASRLVTYATFAWRAYRFGRLLERPDIIVGSIQPLFTGLAAVRLARQYRVPFLLEVRDLWPDALVAKGAVTGCKASVLHCIANHLYRKADRIVSLTPGIKVELEKKGIPPSRLDVFTNGYDPDLDQLIPPFKDGIRSMLGWGNQFVAIYAGTHVEVTAVHVIVRAAAELRHRGDIRFDLFGQGQRKPDAVRLAHELGLKNIHFHDPVPKLQMPGLLSAADVALMTLFRSPLIEIYFENKLIDYMGAGKPILAAMEGLQSKLIREQQVGRVVPAFDHSGLARLVADAASCYEPYRKMGENGRRMVEKYLLLPRILSRYAETIEAVAARQGDKLESWTPLP